PRCRGSRSPRRSNTPKASSIRRKRCRADGSYHHLGVIDSRALGAHALDLRDDAQELGDAVPTGVPGLDRLQPGLRDGSRELGILDEVAELGAHVLLVGGEQEVETGAEQRFDVVPRSTDQWNAAGKRFEHAMRRNPG